MSHDACAAQKARDLQAFSSRPQSPYNNARVAPNTSTLRRIPSAQKRTLPKRKKRARCPATKRLARIVGSHAYTAPDAQTPYSGRRRNCAILPRDRLCTTRRNVIFGNLTAKQNERKRRLFLDAAPTRFYEASSDGISPDLIDIPTPKSSPRTPSLAHIVSKSRYADSECDNAP